MTALALAAALFVSQLDAGSDAPLRTPLLPEMAGPVAPPLPTALRAHRFNWLLPILEAEAFHFGFSAFNNLSSREAFAQISLDSIKSHFDGRAPWSFDVDYFVTNQFGHPYQGSLAFTAARSAGMPFWLAALYPFLSSLTWELFFEVDAPSFNDQITTTLGGIFLGEVLHRAAVLLLSSRRGPGWLRGLGAFLIEPVGQVNRLLLGEAFDAGDVDENPSYLLVLGGGANIGSAVRNPQTAEVVASAAAQVNVQGRLTYGLPGDPNADFRAPFSHFDFDFNWSGPQAPIMSMFIRGLLWGGPFKTADGTRGVAGVFGQYDFAAASVVRISSVGFGLGLSAQRRVTERFFVQLSALLSAVPFASAGSLGLDENLFRDYHIGPGGEVTAELRLVWRRIGWLRFVARSWLTLGAYTPPAGWESITYVTAGPLVRVWGPIALGADGVLAVRRSYFVDSTFDRQFNGATVRLTVNLVSDEDLGTAAR